MRPLPSVPNPAGAGWESSRIRLVPKKVRHGVPVLAPTDGQDVLLRARVYS